MKNLRITLSIVLLLTVLLSACGGAGYPARDVSGIALKAENIPPELRPITESEVAEMGLQGETLIQDMNLKEAQVYQTGAFLNDASPESFGLVVSWLIYPLTGAEVVQVDAEFIVNNLSDSEYINQMMAGMGSDVTSLPGAEEIGDKSLGITFKPTALSGLDAKGDLIVFRNDNGMFMLIGLYATANPIDLVSLAKDLNSQFEAAPTK